jgi:hypothetical protein
MANWEQALLKQPNHDSIEAESVFRRAFREVGIEDADEILSEFEPSDVLLDILENYKAGLVGLAFSGDGIYVSFGRFGNTAVGRVFDSSWGEKSLFVVPKADGAKLSEIAREAIFGLQDGAEWAVFEEGEEYCGEDEEPSDSGTPAELFGFKDLLAKWPRVEEEVRG